MLMLCATISAAQATEAQAEGPILHLVESRHDFGILPTDTVVEHRFGYTNEGQTMLLIADISLSCPCFTVDWSRGPVMPGAAGWVQVSYPTSDKTGAFERMLWIASNAQNNDPQLGRIELQIKGKVVQRTRFPAGAGRKKARPRGS